MSITKTPFLGRAIGAWVRNKSSKKLFKEASPPTGLQHPVIKSFKPKKDLTSRRKTTDEMIEAVDKKYKDVGVKITDEGKKIKKEAVIKGSKIHDKYEKKK